MRAHPAGILALIAVGTFGAACDAVTAPDAPGALPTAALRGRAAFAKDCASCHASGDAVDLAFFNFTDTTIVRRAVAHVDTATALDIVAFVRTLLVRRASRTVRLFQPGGGVVLGGDIAFATALFGADQWPANLTTPELRAIDPLQVKAAVALPLWSLENGNLDWMPDVPLPAAILEDQNGLGQARLAAYREAPTTDNLIRAVTVLRSADRRLANPGAPCVFDVVDRVPDYIACFEARRWTSTLAAQHMIRTETTGRLHLAAHQIWWDVGNAARRAVHAHVALANGEGNWASWMYLGWIFEPAAFPSVYTGNGLMRIGLPRHATFVALRTQVARPAGSVTPYADVEFAARFAPPWWTVNVLRFGYAHLLERLRLGDVPPADRLGEARARVDSAYAVAARKVIAGQHPALRLLADEVLAALP